MMFQTFYAKLYYKKIDHTKWKYQLTGAYYHTTHVYPDKEIKTKYITLETDSNLRMNQGYAWNGANKPAINTKTNRVASLVHDALCQLIRCGKLPFRFRKDADEIFYKICLENGMDPVRAWYSFKAVQLYSIVIRWNRNFRRG